MNLNAPLIALGFAAVLLTVVAAPASAMTAMTSISAEPQCNESAVVATNCYHCPEYSSTREYCANHPEDHAHCSYMVYGVCVLS